MSFVQPAPEAADGGYWYVLEGQDTRMPGVVATGWSADIAGVMYTVYRTVTPVSFGEHADISVAEVLSAYGWQSKPRGRTRDG